MKNIILLTAISNPKNVPRSEAYKYSIESFRKFSGRYKGVEIRVLDEPLFDVEEMKPNFFRYYCFDLLKDEEFDQICLVDSDTIIHPDCPNFFELTENKFTCVHNDGDYDWIIRSIENYQYEFPEQFAFKFDIWKYFNSGFLILGGQDWHQGVFKDLLEFYWKNQQKIIFCQNEYGTGTDQPLINLFMQREQFHNKTETLMKLLPYQFNMQDLPRKNILDDRMLFTRIPGIYHFNGIPGGPEQANYWIKKTYEYLYENSK